VAGASGGLAGGIFGGVAAGAAAGALLGVETGPGAIVTGIVGGVVGGIVGEKVAKEYLSDGVRWLMGSKEEKANPSAGLTSHEVGAGNPSRPNRTTAKGILPRPLDF